VTGVRQEEEEEKTGVNILQVRSPTCFFSSENQDSWLWLGLELRSAV